MLKIRIILIIFIFGLVSTLSGVASGQSEKDLKKAFQKIDEAMEKKEYEKVEAMLKPLSDEGIPEATNGLGVMYSQGLGVEKNNKKAIQLFQLTLKQFPESKIIPEGEKEEIKKFILGEIAKLEKAENAKKMSENLDK